MHAAQGCLYGDDLARWTIDGDGTQHFLTTIVIAIFNFEQPQAFWARSLKIYSSALRSLFEYLEHIYESPFGLRMRTRNTFVSRHPSTDVYQVHGSSLPKTHTVYRLLFVFVRGENYSFPSPGERYVCCTLSNI